MLLGPFFELPPKKAQITLSAKSSFFDLSPNTDRKKEVTFKANMLKDIE